MRKSQIHVWETRISWRNLWRSRDHRCTYAQLLADASVCPQDWHCCSDSTAVTHTGCLGGGYWSWAADGEVEVGRGKGTNQRSCSESTAGGRLDSSLQRLTLLGTRYMLASVRLFIWGFACPITKTSHNNLNSQCWPERLSLWKPFWMHTAMQHCKDMGKLSW